MATNYPNSLDAYSTHIDNNGEKVAAAHINNIQDAIVAIERELGLGARGTYTDVKARIANIEGNYAQSPLTTFALPAVAGWYRIAQSALGISRNDGLFQIDWTATGNHGRATFVASSMFGNTNGTGINLLSYDNYVSGGITKFRIIYHTTYTGNYAYLEVYYSATGSVSATVNAKVLNSIGWSMIAPVSSDTIPVGYTSKEISPTTFGIGTTGQGVFGGDATTPPLVVTGTALIPNLNTEMVSGKKISTTAVADRIPVYNASAKLVGSITGDADSVDGIQGADLLKKDGSVALTGDLNTAGRSIWWNNDGASNIDNDGIRFDDTTNTFHFHADTSRDVTGSAKLQCGGLDAGSGDIKTTGKVYNAVYNDYAEWFEKGLDPLEAGDVVVKMSGVEKYGLSRKAYDKCVVGVVSNSYGHIVGGDELDNMEDNHKNYIPVGLCGRVYVKVTGQINEGDLLVASDVIGCAMSAKEYIPGTVIGKALESNADGRKKVRMFILNQ